MAISEVSANPVGRPWCNVGTDMSPNLLLMCKLLFALLLLHDFFQKIADPFLPFIPVLDLFRSHTGLFTMALKTALLGAGFCLVMNVRVRAAAVVLGLVVVLFILSSKTVYRNHIFIVGCLFLLSGLHRSDEDPWLLRLQLSIIYLGAFTNKLCDPDWRSGEFMHHWLHTELQNPYYECLRPLLPEPWIAILISWMVITSEFLLMILFLVKRWNNVGVWLAVCMHLGFFVVVGRRIFGHFLEDMLLAMLVFLHWPKGTIQVRVRERLHELTARLLPCMSWDRQFRLGPPLLRGGKDWFEVSYGDRKVNNSIGLLQFLKYNTAFYVGVFCLFNGVAFLTSRLAVFS